jgi:transposase
MKAYSDDLRRRVIEAIQANEETQEEIAARFAVSTSFVEKLWHQYRRTGSYQAKPHSGGRKRLLAGAEEVIREIVAHEPDLTLAEIAGKVGAQTQTAPVSEAVMCLELQRLQLPLKKRRFLRPNVKVSEFKLNGANMWLKHNG